MKQLDIYGDNRYENYTKTRVGCRGIVTDNGKILVSFEKKQIIGCFPAADWKTAKQKKVAVCVKFSRKQDIL